MLKEGQSHPLISVRQQDMGGQRRKGLAASETRKGHACVHSFIHSFLQ